MTAALAYLQVTVIRNAAAQRLRRLRRPRYLAATLLGLAYFYFLLLRPGRIPGAAAGAAAAGDFVLLTGVSIGALIMTGRIVYAWIFSTERAALSFTEAEVAFLFPAPLSRRALIHYKLLKAQVRIVFSALLFAVFFRWYGGFTGSVWTRAAGWWLLLSVLELHAIAAAFTRDRLLHVGLNPQRRRLVVGGAFLVASVAAGWWLRQTIPPPGPGDLEQPMALFQYAQRVVGSPPISWLLAPCAWVLGPFFAPDPAAFLRSLGPALLILAGHYVWVIRAEVAFEEASLDLARRRAERSEARGAGRWAAKDRPVRRRAEPFRLGSSGPAPTAFLWRAMLAAGPWFYPRNWLYIALGTLGALLWAGSHPGLHPVLTAVQFAAPTVAAWALIIGPMLMRREVRLMMQRLDVVKTYPLRGWQVILGEMLAPVVLITAVEWFLIAVLGVAAASSGQDCATTLLSGGAGAIAAGLLVPPIVALMTAIPFAATLCFPAWMSTLGQPSGGLDVLGQRLMFAGGYLVVLAAALLPAAAAAAVPYFIVSVFSGSQAPALVTGAIAASLVLGGELAVVVWWLGERYEAFDLSAEGPLQ